MNKNRLNQFVIDVDSLPEQVFKKGSAVGLLKLTPTFFAKEESEDLKRIDYKLYSDVFKHFLKSLGSSHWKQEVIAFIGEEQSKLDLTQQEEMLAYSFLERLKAWTEIDFKNDEKGEDGEVVEPFSFLLDINDSKSFYHLNEYQVQSYSLQEDVVKDDSQIIEEIEDYIKRFKYRFGVKEVFYTHFIQPENLLKSLSYSYDCAVRIARIFEVEDLQNVGLKDISIAFSLSEHSHYENDILFIAEDFDNFYTAFLDLFIKKLNQYSKTISNKFKAIYYENSKRKDLIEETAFAEKEELLSAFVSYLRNNSTQLEQNNITGVFVEETINICNSIAEVIEQSGFELKEGQAEEVYNAWVKGFIHRLSNFNVKRVLDDNKGFKIELYKLAICFRYLAEERVVFNVWKDLTILNKMCELTIKSGSLKDDDYISFERDLFKLFFIDEYRELFFKEMKNVFVDELVKNDLKGYINNWRNNVSLNDGLFIPQNSDMEMIYLESFWGDEEIRKMTKEILHCPVGLLRTLIEN